LERAFLMIALMTAPVWLAMILFPSARIVKVLAQPLVLPPVFCTVLIILLWKSFDGGLLPTPIGEATYSAAQRFARHPISFLALFCNLQILNLAVGTLIYQKAQRSGFTAPVELILCWFLGALALIPFALRL